MPTEPKHMKVKRYRYFHIGNMVDEHPAGEFVYYSDIEPALTLLNQLDEMGVSDAVREITDLRKEIQDMKDAAEDAAIERKLSED